MTNEQRWCELWAHGMSSHDIAAFDGELHDTVFAVIKNVAAGVMHPETCSICAKQRAAKAAPHVERESPQHDPTRDVVARFASLSPDEVRSVVAVLLRARWTDNGFIDQAPILRKLGIAGPPDTWVELCGAKFEGGLRCDRYAGHVDAGYPTHAARRYASDARIEWEDA